MPKIYTRKGDGGQTGLGDGRRVPKADLRVRACGEVDELGAALGLALALATCVRVREMGGELQRDLFALGAQLAGAKPKEKIRIAAERVTQYEQWIDELGATLPPLRKFVLPGGSPGGAALHLARTVGRRAERALVELAAREKVPDLALALLNRMGDLLFVLARAQNREAGADETPW